jgi:hypothetical protein
MRSKVDRKPNAHFQPAMPEPEMLEPEMLEPEMLEPESNDAHFDEPGSQFLIPRKPIPSATPLTGASNSHCNQPSKERPHSTADQVLRIWWLEIVCSILFLASLFAIVATLYSYEGKQPPNWRYRLSLNTLIAIYAVILKAAMLLVTAQGLSQLKWRWFEKDHLLRDLTSYDNASRGPWGSLKLLWRLRARHTISSIGASITIAALLVDPFAQQVVSTQDCEVIIQEQQSTIPRTNYYSEAGKGSALGMTIGLPMQNSINAGIFNPGGNVQFQCPTGNCTFLQPYHSVAYCSNCLDLTNNLTIWNYTMPTKETGPDQAFNISLSPAEGEFGYTSTYSFLHGNKNGVSSVFVMQSYDAYTDIVLGLTDANVSSGPCAEGCDDLSSCQGNLTWGCGSIWHSNDTADWVPGFDSNSTGIGAARCSLFPCVQTYSATVDYNRLSEELISVATEWSELDNSMLDIGCLSPPERISVANAGYHIVNEAWIPYNYSADKLPNDTGSINRDCIYSLATFSAKNLESFLATFLNGSLTIGEEGYDFDIAGPATLQTIYNNQQVSFQRINETWNNLSQAITTHMRQNGAYGTAAIGNTIRNQSCLRARWAFLAYPAALVVLTIVFFIAMVLETNAGGRGEHDWKSSPLPLLFHGLDRDSFRSTTQGRELVRVKDMDDVAAGLSVRLCRSGGYWNLMGAKDEPLIPLESTKRKAWSRLRSRSIS